MEWAFMVVAIVGIVTWGKIHRARLGIIEDKQGNMQAIPRDAGEAERLRAEVNDLKARIATLERITVERENSLARQIDDLRDR